MRNRFESVPSSAGWLVWDDSSYKALPEEYDSLKEANEMCRKLNKADNQESLQLHSEHEKDYSQSSCRNVPANDNECHFMEVLNGYK